MEKRRLLLWLIFLVTLISVIIDLPKSYHLKFNLGSKEIDTTITRPFGFLDKFRLVKGLDLAGGVHLMFKAKMDDIDDGAREDAINSLKDNIERRVNFFGVSEAVVQTSRVSDEYRLIVELPGIVNVDEAVALVGKTAELEFRETIDLPPEATSTATVYDLFSGKTGLTGRH